MLYPYRLITGALLLAFLNGGAICIGLNTIAYAHEEHRFAAGKPGDPKKPARTIKVAMREDGKKMAFEPARIPVRKGPHRVVEMGDVEGAAVERLVRFLRGRVGVAERNRDAVREEREVNGPAGALCHANRFVRGELGVFTARLSL